MHIRLLKTGKTCEVIIEPVVEKDYKTITKSRYFFDWKKQKETSVYKLRLISDNSILGLVSFISHDDEARIEINLLSVSKENRGRKKEYEGIAGCLIAFVCRMAITYYGSDACVSLIPKTSLRYHYMEIYGMEEAGISVYLEGDTLIKLLLKYQS